MLQVSKLPRVFLFKNHNQTIKLTDPNPAFTPQQVCDFFSVTYPILTTAKISGPEMGKDQMEYTFSSVLGTKG